MSVVILWLRIVGSLYLLMFVAAVVVRAPIKAEGPEGLLADAAAGNPTARYAVDTWLMLGLYFAVIGCGLFVASRTPADARLTILAVLGFEVVGIFIDVYKLARGYKRGPPLVWLAIHVMVIATGLNALGRL